MSVVNKMLQDLESRESADAIQADYVPPKKSNATLLVLLAVLVVALIIVGYLFYSQQQNESGVAPLPVAQEKQTLPAELDSTSEPVNETIPTEPLIDSQQTASTPVENPQTDSIPATQSSMDELKEAAPDVALLHAETVDEDVKPLTAEEFLAQENESVTEPTPEPVLSVTPSERDPNAGLKDEARLAIARGDNREAITSLQRLMGREPENLTARKKLAALLYSQQRIGDAEAVLQAGMVLHPSNSDLHLMLGRLVLQQRGPDQAMDVLRQLSVSSDPDFLAFRANVAEQVSDYEQAEKDYVSLLSEEGANARWWLGLAIVSDKAGKLQQARRAYLKVQEHGPLDRNVMAFVSQRLSQLSRV